MSTMCNTHGFCVTHSCTTAEGMPSTGRHCLAGRAVFYRGSRLGPTPQTATIGSVFERLRVLADVGELSVRCAVG